MALLRAAITLAGVMLVAALPVAATAKGELTEAHAKAGFLYNCAMFIEWPSGNHANDLVIGISAADPVASVMDDVAGRPVNGRTLRVKLFRPTDNPSDFQILYVGGEDPRSAADVLARIGNAPVLTVGEQHDFTARGGVVRLYTDRERLRFEINMTRAERAGLRVSAKMLGLAKIVR